MDSMGKLIIKAFGADEAFPIEDAIVRIKGSDSINSEVIHTVFTDEDGVTAIISLPSPPVENSESPGIMPAFYNYTVSVEKEGYYTKVLKGVSVFPGVLSVLNVNMIPYVPYVDGGRYPRGNSVSEE